MLGEEGEFDLSETDVVSWELIDSYGTSDTASLFPDS